MDITFSTSYEISNMSPVFNIPLLAPYFSDASQNNKVKVGFNTDHLDI